MIDLSGLGSSHRNKTIKDLVNWSCFDFITMHLKGMGFSRKRVSLESNCMLVAE